MRTYFQQQLQIKPVTAKESTEIMKLSKKYYRFVRWEFSKGELCSEMLTISGNPLNEESEYKVFRAFAQEIEESFPTVQVIKLQYYSIHELPTSCFVLEKKTKRDKHDKPVPAPLSNVDFEPDPIVDVEPRTDPNRETD